MKKIFKLLLSIIFVLCTWTFLPVQAEDATAVAMYRVYNPNSGEHFYTSNTSEKDNLVSLGWSYEGIGWYAPTSGNPVYRLYNANGGEHHYTLSVEERNNLINAGWKYEGIGWYSVTDWRNAVPVYREYNPNAFANNHNYTTSQSEHSWLISLGWKPEGVGWYGLEHEHNWVAQTKVVHHDATGHYETQTETYETTEIHSYYKCFGSGVICYTIEELTAQIATMTCGRHGTVPVEVPVTKTREVQVWVQDIASYDETVTTGYKCSICEATKTN